MSSRTASDQTCIRCAAHHAAVPQDEQLRWVLNDKRLDEVAYAPKPIDGDQAYAVSALVSAIQIYADAFGIRNAAARLQLAAELMHKGSRIEALQVQTMEAAALREERGRQAATRRPARSYGGWRRG